MILLPADQNYQATFAGMETERSYGQRSQSEERGVSPCPDLLSPAALSPVRGQTPAAYSPMRGQTPDTGAGDGFSPPPYDRFVIGLLSEFVLHKAFVSPYLLRSIKIFIFSNRRMV